MSAVPARAVLQRLVGGDASRPALEAESSRPALEAESSPPALEAESSPPAESSSAVARLAGQVASALVQQGARWPALAAACLAARGIAGDFEQADWASRLRLPRPTVEAAEAGALPPDQVPADLLAAADRAWPSWRRWPAGPAPGARRPA